MTTIFIHNEFWDDRTGSDILAEAIKAAGELIDPSTVHVYTPSALTARGSDWGEVELWWSVTMNDASTVGFVAEAIRRAYIRVKTAGVISSNFATCDYDTLWAEIDRMWFASAGSDWGSE